MTTTNTTSRVNIAILLAALLSPCLPAGAKNSSRADAMVPRRLSPAIFPFYSECQEGRNLAFGIAERAGAELFQTGSYNHFHLKQVLRASRQQRLSLEALSTQEAALNAATILGAQCGVFGTLKRGEKGGWVLRFTAFDLRSGENKDVRMDLPVDQAKTVRIAGTAVAAAIASLDGVRLTENLQVHPRTDSAVAMGAYLACFAVLVEQPMGLRKSHVLDSGRMAAARKACEKAVKVDPDFAAAWATLSLAYSLSFKNAEAARALKRARQAKGYLPFGRIAHYWLATRFRSSADGARVLNQAIRDFPGALIFLTYLGQHLNIVRKYDEALDVWNRYLEFVMKSPWAMAQKGYSLARLGRLDLSIEITGKASLMDPDSMELKLELASRLVDAKRLAEAEDILVPIAKATDTYGEVLLRLGYVYLLQKKDGQALQWLNRALAMAKGPNEWRTRGRIRYDLAIIMARKGRPAEAEQHLLAAADEGFMVRDLLQKNEDLRVLASRRRVAHLFKHPKLKVDKDLLYSTPFPVDPAGDVDPDAKRPAIPGFTF